MNRRDFLRIMGGAGALVSCPQVLLLGCRRALAQTRTAVIWLQGQSCSGCSVSLLNSEDPDIAGLLTGHISLAFHQTLSSGTGDTALQVIRKAVTSPWKDFILIIEGSVPAGSGYFCTLGERGGHHRGIAEWIVELGAHAREVIAVGSCAAYGGIPAAGPRDGSSNPTGAQPIWSVLPEKRQINIPGCPPHPDWIVGTIIQVLLGRQIKLDAYHRPLTYFEKTVHDNCEHLDDYKNGKFARQWGHEGCLYELGCLGIDTNCDIPVRKWVGTSNSCTGCGSGCIGCTEPVFPDMGSRGIYQHRSG